MSWDDAPLPYQSLDEAGRLCDVNAPWCEWSGYSEEEVVGRLYRDFVPEDHWGDFEAALATFVEKGHLRAQECFFKRKDGSVRNVLIYGTMYRIPDGGLRSHCMMVDVTSHRETERLLGESEERFRNLFQLAPNPMVVHDGKSIVFANAAAAHFLGYDESNDMIGVPVASVVAEESRPQVAERVRRMLAEDWIAPLTEECFARKDGAVVRGDTIASPITIGGKRLIQVAAIDLTARYEAETALRESEQRYRQVFDSSADGVVVHDGTIVLLANDALRRYLGFETGTVEGLRVQDFVSADAQRVVGERISSLLEGETGMTPPLEISLVRPDGGTWYAEITSTSFIMNGQRVIQTTFRDLTERKRTERELAKYRVELERLVDERTATLHRVQAELESVTAVIARTVELRDPYTAGHQRRVAELCVAVAQELGMTDEQIGIIHTAASIHDIGKVSVPAEILSKPGRFSPIEYELVKTHALSGYEIIASAELGGDIAEIVGQHHERLDGSGYPQGLTTGSLLPGAKVLMVADVVEAMSSHRPYRPAIGIDAALEEIQQGRAVLYDPEVVDACVSVLGRGFEFSAEG